MTDRSPTPHRFSICMPSLNAGERIADSLRSIYAQTILSQSDVSIQVLIVDGESTDDTLAIIARETATHQQKKVEVAVISEPDRNVHEALWKAIAAGDGDIFSFLGAGDIYAPTALELVAQIMDDHQRLWVAGIQAVVNRHLQIATMIFPFRYQRRLIERGLYNRWKPTYIQAEGTFWDQSLNVHIDSRALQSWSYAGDYYLWWTFARVTEPTIIASYLGGFRLHEGQNSRAIDRYHAEVKAMSARPTLFDLVLSQVYRVLWYMPLRVKKFLNPHYLLVYDDENDQWR